MKRICIVGMMLSGAVAFADESTINTFPDAGGDLANDWGESTPGTKATIRISKGGTYTLGADASFGNLDVTTSDAVTFDFTGTPTRKLTLNNTSSADKWQYPATYGYGFAPLVNGDSDITFKGGIWDFANGNHFYSASSGQANSGGKTLITDGAVITNVNFFYFGEHSVKMATVIDNARVYAKKLSNWATGNHNTFTITNGAQVILSDAFQTDREGGAGPATGFNTIRVSGTGSLLETLSQSESSQVGVVHQGNLLEVTDYATLKVPSCLNIGTDGVATSNGVLRISDHAVAGLTGLHIGGKNSQHNRFELLDGASATIGNLKIGNTAYASWSSVFISNATLNVTNAFALGNSAYANSNEFWVVDGATVSGVPCVKDLYVGYSYGNVIGVRNAEFSLKGLVLGVATNSSGSGGFGGNGLRVEDRGKVTHQNVITIGQGAHDNYVSVSNGTLTIQGAYLGSGGSWNEMRITQGTVHVTGSALIDMGIAVKACSNRFEMTDGSLMDDSNGYGVFKVGDAGSWNELLAADSCLTCGTLRAGVLASAHDNTILLRNMDLTVLFTNSTHLLTGTGHHNTFTLQDTDLDCGVNYLNLSQGSNNTIRLIGNSTLTESQKTTYLDSSNDANCNNMFYIGAGATANLLRFRIRGINDSLVISNGTMNITDTGNDISIAYTENEHLSSNNVLRLEGETPRLISATRLTFKNNSALEVVVPPNKYAKGYVPITTASVSFDETCRIRVEGDKFFSRKGGLITLLEVTDNNGIKPSADVINNVINNSLAEMPEGCELFVSADGKKIQFRAPNREGTVFIVR